MRAGLPCSVKTLQERFWKHVARRYVKRRRAWRAGDGKCADIVSCWLWKAGTDGHGYGKMRVDGTHYIASRLAFFLDRGHWPRPGLLVCHTCDNKLCVNPHHLYEGTYQDNALDRLKADHAPGTQRVKACRRCGGPVTGEGNYCSYACWKLTLPARVLVDRTCAHCGKSFKALASDVARGRGKFCSSGCTGRFYAAVGKAKISA